MRRVSALIVAVAWTLAGCTPGGEPTTPPATTEPAVTPPPAVTPTPTPQWTEEEQAAIAAVYEYREAIDHIAQNLDTADWNEIWQVSTDDAANEMLNVWLDWHERGWHQVGASEFMVDRVGSGMTDDRGKRYHVYGCYLAGSGHLVDEQGNPAVPDAVTAADAHYVVLRTLEGQYLVADDDWEEAPCGPQ
jgi:N-methylhydantoinase B/oxoprolinase/acetone carboxylase alpha subunit